MINSLNQRQPNPQQTHATADTELVTEFVDTVLLATGLREDQIFVSSIPGMGVPAGENLLAHIRTVVDTSTLVVAVVSKTYTTRPVCIAELGAAWGVAGKLHPILVPGVDRAGLDGVLQGLKADYLNEEHALDELQQRIEDDTGVRPTTTSSWNRRRRKWLQRVDALVAKLPEPEIATMKELTAARDRVAATEADLDEAERENEVLRKQVDKLSNVKDRAEVIEALLSDDDVERFHELRKRAQADLEEVSMAVREGIRCRIAKETFVRPDRYIDVSMSESVDEAITDGYLNDQEEYLELNEDFGPVDRAIESAERLMFELERGFGDSFDDWFRSTFDGPPELGRKAIWRQVFPRL